MIMIMSKTLKLFAAAAVILGIAACSTPKKMTQMAENISVTCQPAILEAAGGFIDATVSVKYPADYFNPKAILEVTPVIVYSGGEAKMKPFVYQGDKVKDNYKVISSAGQTVTEKIHFDYVEGMEKSYLELRGVVKAKGKDIALPVVKVADGVNTTYMLVKQDGVCSYKKDNYQETYTDKAEGQIIYEVNSSEVRSSELNSESMKKFRKTIEEMQAKGVSVTGTEIVAYASPEGAIDLNNKLSEDRSKSAEKAWNDFLKGKDVAAPEVKSLGEDWEGFQKLVQESNIEDKDLILRVLSMYSDPAVRESEIRNMSEIFLALKGEVLPELRRARFIANVEYANYSSEELLKMVEDNNDVLDEEALLRAASLVKDDAHKEALYNKAVSKFGSDRAKYNLAVLYLGQDKATKAANAISGVPTDDPDVQNVLGVIALRKGEIEKAGNYFAASGTDDAKANIGIVDILLGNYDKAAQELAEAKGCCHNKALAYILTDQLDKASEAITCECAGCLYLKAIIAARKGSGAGVKTYLEQAFQKDKSLKDRAATDIEFALYSL